MKEIKKELVDKIEKEIMCFPKLIPVLKILKKKCKLGIVSSNSREYIIQFLKRNKIDHLFDFIYSDSSILGKYNVLKRVCKKYELLPDQIIFIGDEVRDIEACKKIQIKIIAVTWGYNSKKFLVKFEPDYVVDEPKEILEIVMSACVSRT